MKIYNQEKTEILENADLEKGYLIEDTLTTHIDYVAPIQEVGHYETIREYPNGGKDVKWVVEVQGVKEVPEHDTVEQIQVYIPYTAEELQKMADEKEIAELKQYLADTDYQVIKCYDRGLVYATEYPEDFVKRQQARDRINELLNLEA